MPDQTRTVAEQFAQALDREDYGIARRLLSEDCISQNRGAVFVGPAEIISSYRASSEQAAQKFDEIAYASSVDVAPEPRAAVITFEDRIRHRDQTLVHRCRQVVRLDTDGRISAIEHCDLPGERESLQSFLANVGLDKGDD